MKNIYNFGLIFDNDHNSAFVRYSQALNESLRSDFILGERSLPHLTVLQFEAEADSIKQFWADVERLDALPLPLGLAGLTFLPSKEGHIWIEIAVLKSNRLRQLQDAAVSLAGDAKIHSGTGDSFRPHITMARAVNTRELKGIIVDDSVVRRKNVIGRISLGLSGENYQYEELIFS